MYVILTSTFVISNLSRNCLEPFILFFNRKALFKIVAIADFVYGRLFSCVIHDYSGKSFP